MKRQSPERAAFVALNTLFLILLAFTMIIPFVNVLAVSLTTDLESYENLVKLYPRHPSIEGYITLFMRVNILRPLVNNTIVTVIGTFAHVLLCAMAGYVLVRERFPGKTIIVLLVTLPMMVPFEMIMLPVYVTMKFLGLIDTLLSLILTGVVSTFSIVLMKNYFESIPPSLEESAFIDGANEFRIFFSVFMPLALPGLATIAIFDFVGRWNQFLPAVLFINSPQKYTLQVALRSLVVSQETSDSTQQVANNTRMAGIVVSVIPLMLVYVFAQKFFIRGVMVGAVKE
jgi:putative aldouronate transport system permease protein